MRIYMEKTADKNITVSDIMTKNPITVTLNNTIKETLKILFENHISGAPIVTQDGKIEGIISSLDLLVASGLQQFNMNLHELTGNRSVKKEVYHIYHNEPIKNALLLIVQKRIGRVVVLNGLDKLVGIITRSDLMKYYAKLLNL